MAIDKFFEFAKTKFYYVGRNEIKKPMVLSATMLKNLKRAAEEVEEADNVKKNRMNDDL